MNGAVEIQITQPGRPTGIYVQSDFDRLKLDGFYYPDEILPFDLAIVPKTLTTGGENLRALLLGTKLGCLTAAQLQLNAHIAAFGQQALQ